MARKGFQKSILLGALLLAACLGDTQGRLKKGMNLYNQGLYSQSITILRPLADEHVPEALWAMGQIFLQGHTGKRDPFLGQSMLAESAAAGYAPAQLDYGLLLLHGADPIVAQPFAALEWIEKAANQNHGAAQWQMGVLYKLGLHGGAPQQDQARLWFEKAALQGDPRAQLQMGLLLAQEGQDREQAIKWLLRAVVHEDPVAMYDLAVMLHQQSPEKNAKEARLWARKAKALGSAEAKEFLDDPAKAVLIDPLQGTTTTKS